MCRGMERQVFRDVRKDGVGDGTAAATAASQASGVLMIGNDRSAIGIKT